jgi:hypothetical protein
MNPSFDGLASRFDTRFLDLTQTHGDADPATCLCVLPAEPVWKVPNGELIIFCTPQAGRAHNQIPQMLFSPAARQDRSDESTRCSVRNLCRNVAHQGPERSLSGEQWKCSLTLTSTDRELQTQPNASESRCLNSCQSQNRHRHDRPTWYLPKYWSASSSLRIESSDGPGKPPD